MIYKLLNAIQLFGVNVNSPKYTSFLETYKSILKNLNFVFSGCYTSYYLSILYGQILKFSYIIYKIKKIYEI